MLQRIKRRFFFVVVVFSRFDACRMDMTCARNWAKDPRGQNCTGTCVQYQQVHCDLTHQTLLVPQGHLYPQKKSYSVLTI